MRSFFILLQKELRELFTWQIVVPIVLVAAIFLGLGSVISSEQEKAKGSQRILVVDNDGSAASATVKDLLGKANFTVITASDQPENTLVEQAKKENTSVALVIPKGFGEGVASNTIPELTSYSVIRSFSISGNQSGLVLESAMQAINTYFSAQLISSATSIRADRVLQPVATIEKVAVGDTIATGKTSQVLGYVNAQTLYIPMILFLVISFAAQMIATAVASEKENKTIETLLTMPVSRKQIVVTKMLAAGLVALIMSAVYMVGLRGYVGGFGTMGESEGARVLIEQLGLNFTLSSYTLLGTSLFMGILVSLALALILGSFAEDVKGVQGLITPLMVLVLIPYVLSFVLDFSSLSGPARALIYAIPFTHSFIAAPNLLLQQTTPVLWGILYQFVVFIIFVYIAAKIFTTDRIVTMKISFSKKKVV